jgi:hypothetical protein
LPWPPGVSGNPKGRSKLPIEELRAHARIYTADAVRTLVRALSDKSGQVRVLAADKLLSRGWGVPGVMDGDGLAGSITIVVSTGIDRRPLAEDATPVEAQPLTIEHEAGAMAGPGADAVEAGTWVGGGGNRRYARGLRRP